MDHDNSFTVPVNPRRYAFCALVFLLTISGGCAGEDDVAPDHGSKIVVEPNKTLSTAPHTFDVYRAVGADKAIVFLHGGGNTKSYFAYQLGLKSTPDDSSYDDINGQILLDNKAIAVFPQAQAPEAYPRAKVWNNYVEDSGQDDMQFIRDLVSFIAAHYDVSKFYLVGHSSGGVMTSRIWCEAPELFDAYVSIAGPASAHFLAPETPCSPTKVKPYLKIIGAQDGVWQNGDWEAQIWTLAPILELVPTLVEPDGIGERYFLPNMVSLRCGEAVRAGDADAVTDGTITTWSFCDSSIELVRIEAGGHAIESLEGASGYSMMKFVFDFINGTK